MDFILHTRWLCSALFIPSIILHILDRQFCSVFFFFNNKMYSFMSLSGTALFLQLQRPCPFLSCHIPFLTFFSPIKYECSSLCSFPLNADQNQAPTLHTHLLPLFLFTPLGLQSLNFPPNNWHSSVWHSSILVWVKSQFSGLVTKIANGLLRPKLFPMSICTGHLYILTQFNSYITLTFLFLKEET